VYFDRQRTVLDRFKDDFDYLLGGFHGLKFDGAPFFNFVWAKGREVLDTYGEERIHAEYFKKMRSIINTGYFDILAHFDNHRLLWRPNEPVYSPDIWCEILDLLDLVKSQGMAVEINTSGIRKGGRDQFPSDEIVKEMIRRDIPLVLSSDAHQPEEIGYGFAEFIEKAKPWGLTHLCSYEKRRQRLVPIE
jgi:histidinol-phosphatase (PHP family)